MRALSSGHKLPANPHWIEFTRSDGAVSNQPSDTTWRRDGDGLINFMRPVPLDESFSVGWRIGFGKALAAKLDLPEGPEYVIKEWPSGYELFDHNKEQRGVDGKIRHDPYLCGSMHVRRFRSIPEFVPHAYWLLTDAALDRGNCECKYCSHIPQRLISERMGFLSTRSSSSTPSQTTAGPSQAIFSSIRPSAPRGTASRPYRPLPQTTVRKSLHMSRAPATKRLRDYTAMDVKPVELEEEGLNRPNHYESGRLNDVRGAFASSNLSLPRWFRAGEVVWCKVPDSPILRIIEYWPGVVESWRIKTVSKPGNNATDGLDRETLQWTVYAVRLLGLQGCVVKVPDFEVLPYQLHSTPQSVWTTLGRLIQDQDTFDWSELQQLNPFEANRNLATSGDPVHVRELARSALLEQAAAPFALAASLASKLSEHYCPLLEYTHESPVPAMEKSKVRSSRAKEATELTIHFGEDGRIVNPARPKGPVKRTEYEALWWGPEKLWIDDLVRLKPLRGDFSPQGNPHVLPPSGGSSRTSATSNHITQPHRPGGAEHRGLFLLVKSFQPADPLVARSQFKSRVIVTGKLFELACADCTEVQSTGHHSYKFGPATGTSAFMNNPLPVPPPGFVWRPILKKGFEIRAESGVIAGRYYGRLMEHPLIDIAKNRPIEDFAPHQAAMFGFSPGYDNAINPKKWQRERGDVEKQGNPRAQQEVEQFGREASVVDDTKSEDINSDGDEDVEMF